MRYGSNRCPSCGGEPVDGKVSCQKCLDRRKLSRLNKPPGICLQCSRLSAPGKTRCTICSSISAEQSKVRRQNNLANGLCSCGSIPKEGCITCQSCIDKSVIRNRKTMLKLRITTFEHYGDICSCCGIDTIEFLSLDHINNDGSKHRESIGSGITFYRWVVKNFPSDLQTLCWNCNCAKGRKSICPHHEIYVPLTSKQRCLYKLKLKVIDAYGGCCTCCGENNPSFLNIDHINDDGARHRKEINQKNSSTTYRWAVKNDYPDTLQILCWNCNMAKRIYGTCPHKLSPVEHK